MGMFSNLFKKSKPADNTSANADTVSQNPVEPMAQSRTVGQPQAAAPVAEPTPPPAPTDQSAKPDNNINPQPPATPPAA